MDECDEVQTAWSAGTASSKVAQVCYMKIFSPDGELCIIVELTGDYIREIARRFLEGYLFATAECMGNGTYSV